MLRAKPPRRNGVEDIDGRRAQRGESRPLSPHRTERRKPRPLARLARMYGKPRAGIAAHRLCLLDPRCSVALDNDHARTGGLVFGVRNSEELLAWANSMVRADGVAGPLGPRLQMDVAPGHPKKPAHAHDESCAPNRRAGNDARQILTRAPPAQTSRPGNLDLVAISPAAMLSASAGCAARSARP